MLFNTRDDSRRGELKPYFDWVIRKRLAAVETSPRSSNQHELNATKEVRVLLGTARQRFETEFIYFDGEQSSITDSGVLTYYDSREKHPTRSEHRIYYSGNAVTELMDEGDVLFLAKLADGGALFIVAVSDSNMPDQLAWLFGLDQQADLTFDGKDFDTNATGNIDFMSRHILDTLGIEYEDPKANQLDTIIERFGFTFPTTKTFSDLARQTLPGVSAKDDPDLALVTWLDHEEAMFRRLEKRIVSRRLVEGFMDGDDADVDAFIKFSLSVQNRRKSRMGHSLEHHIRAVLKANDIRFTEQFRTAKGKKPDFLFPSSDAYMDVKFPTSLLTMLGAKSSSKERWSQILSEADRIQEKHLLTLDPSIPSTTLKTMKSDQLQLVVPNDRHPFYPAEHQSWLMDVADFISLVEKRQRQIDSEGHQAPV